jgi:HEAT repeat protein
MKSKDNATGHAVRMLLARAESNATSEVHAAIEQLTKLKSHKATRPLLALLSRSGDLSVRLSIVQAFWLLRDSRSAPTLVHLARSPNEHPTVRSLAVEGLGFYRRRRFSDQAIRGGLSDPDPGVRISALCAIGAIGVTGFERNVTPLLDDHATYRHGKPVSEYAAFVLGIRRPWPGPWGDYPSSGS